MPSSVRHFCNMKCDPLCKYIYKYIIYFLRKYTIHPNAQHKYNIIIFTTFSAYKAHYNIIYDYIRTCCYISLSYNNNNIGSYWFSFKTEFHCHRDVYNYRGRYKFITIDNIIIKEYRKTQLIGTCARERTNFITFKYYNV